MVVVIDTADIVDAEDVVVVIRLVDLIAPLDVEVCIVVVVDSLVLDKRELVGLVLLSMISGLDVVTPVAASEMLVDSKEPDVVVNVLVVERIVIADELLDEWEVVVELQADPEPATVTVTGSTDIVTVLSTRLVLTVIVLGFWETVTVTGSIEA